MKIHPFRKKKAETSGPAKAEEAKTRAEQVKEAGQIIAIFALALTALIGLVGIAVDVTFAWREELRIQRAADAAALAGVVYLPGNVSGGQSASVAEAGKNGYQNGVNFTTITAEPNPPGGRQMDVSITTRVPTFFLRALGVDHFTVSRSSKAVFVLPVPMGSPDPYYGAYGNFPMKNPSGGADVTVTMTNPSGTPITGRKFWATMLTQGAGAASGDAFLPKKLNANQTAASPVNPGRATTSYYDYGVYMPPGVSGNVYIFDPVFCAGDGRYGTGDYYLNATGGGTGVTPVSSFFELWNTNNQPYYLPAHTKVPGANSGTLFYANKYSDKWANANASNVQPYTTTCQGPASTYPADDARHYHNDWYKLTPSAISGGPTGTMYRLRTTTDTGEASQDSANAYNDFAIYVTGSGAQVYGLGAMEMYTLLPVNDKSTLYLAQIDAQSGAGKTMQVKLWDVGDTNGINSSIEILNPDGQPAQMTWTATKVATVDVGPCPSGSGKSITTFTSGTKQYNGCWLTITIPIPNSYAPPAGGGWWMIRYTTGTGSGTQTTDLTTWMVDIRGNPVHLIP